MNSDPHEGFSVICLLFFNLTSTLTSSVLSREASYFRSGFGVSFFVVDDDFSKIFMVSFFTHFIFDYIKNKYLFALHETSNHLLLFRAVVHCNLLIYLIIEDILFPCFLTFFMSIIFTPCLPPLFFSPSLYLIFPMSWRHHNQEKLQKISNHLPNPFFVFCVSATALEEAKQASNVIYLNYLIKNFNMLPWTSYQSSCSWIWVT